MMHLNYLDSLHNALNHKGKVLWFLVDFQVSKSLARSIFSIGRTHDGTRIDASNVLSFDRLLQSLFTQFCLENPRSHRGVLAKPKLQSWNCKIWLNWKVSARVPRLESNYAFICELQPLCYVTRSFLKSLRYEGWKLCKAHFLQPFAKVTMVLILQWFIVCWHD